MSGKKLALATAAALLATGGAQAACNYDLSALDKKIGSKGYDTYSGSARDIRQMRDTARTLSEYKQDKACKAVVNAINNIVNKKMVRSEERNAAGSDMSAKDRSSRKEAKAGKADRHDTQAQDKSTAQKMSRADYARNAKPVWSDKQAFSASKMVGSSIYSISTSKSVGEIDDVLISNDAESSFVIISHGGFLGIGEKKYKVSLDAVRYNAQDNSYYVTITNKELEKAPQVKWQDRHWVGQAVTVTADSKGTGSSNKTSDKADSAKNTNTVEKSAKPINGNKDKK